MSCWKNNSDPTVQNQGLAHDASSRHAGGCHFGFADGSVRFLSENIDSWDLDATDHLALWRGNPVAAQPGLYQWLSTPNRGEVIPGDY